MNNLYELLKIKTSSILEEHIREIEEAKPINDRVFESVSNIIKQVCEHSNSLIRKEKNTLFDSHRIILIVRIAKVHIQVEDDGDIIIMSSGGDVYTNIEKFEDTILQVCLNCLE